MKDNVFDDATLNTLPEIADMLPRNIHHFLSACLQRRQLLDFVLTTVTFSSSQDLSRPHHGPRQTDVPTENWIRDLAPTPFPGEATG